MEDSELTIFFMFKKSLYLIIGIFLFIQLSCFSENINDLNTNSISYQFNKQLTNRVYTIEIGGLYGLKNKDAGGFLSLYTPIVGTNIVFGAGASCAFIGGSFYNATVNGRITIPIGKLPIYPYFESGGGFNITRGEMVSQEFFGIIYKKDFKKHILTFGGAIGKISDYKGNIIAGGGSFTF